MTCEYVQYVVAPGCSGSSGLTLEATSAQRDFVLCEGVG